MASENASDDMEQIERCLRASERATMVIREADYARRYTALELRETQIALEEDYRRLNEFMETFEKQVKKETVENRKWVEKKIGEAKRMAEEALQSVLMVADVQGLEKKVEALSEAVLRANRLYNEYASEMNTKELLDEVKDVFRAVEHREKVALEGVETDEATLEHVFRAAIEQLYGLKSSSPKVLEEAKKLAAELRPLRDAAANHNFYAMVARPTEHQSSSGSSSSSSSSTEHSFSSVTSASLTGSTEQSTGSRSNSSSATETSSTSSGSLSS